MNPEGGYSESDIIYISIDSIIIIISPYTAGLVPEPCGYGLQVIQISGCQ